MAAALLGNVSCLSGTFAQRLRSTNLCSNGSLDLPGALGSNLSRRGIALSTLNRGLHSEGPRRLNVLGRRVKGPLSLPSLPSGRIAPSAGLLAIPQTSRAKSSVLPGLPPVPSAINHFAASLTGSDLGRPTNIDDHYNIGQLLGSGSFGQVFRGTHRKTGEEVAIKVLPKDGNSRGRTRGSGRIHREKVLVKLQREIDQLERLQGQGNTISLKGVYENHESVFVVMECCNGGDLESYLKEHGALSERDAALLIQECLKTVQACHANNIYHGDIKPANFMLKYKVKGSSLEETLADAGHEDGWLKAIDFGCAQSVEPGVPLTRKTGTPIFMAPEVYVGNYGKEADVWSVGMIMYQFIANRFPFWESMESLRSTTLEQVMMAVIGDDIPLDYGPWLSISPEGLDLIKRLLHRNPETRITAAEALQHPWFAQHCQGPALERQVSGNIIPLTKPLSRSVSDSMRLRMAAAQLKRVKSQKGLHKGSSGSFQGLQHQPSRLPVFPEEGHDYHVDVGATH